MYYFKNKRQEKDFNIIFNSIYFDIDKDVKTNAFNCILINIDELSVEDFNKAVEFVKKLNNKNITINTNRKTIVIS